MDNRQRWPKGLYVVGGVGGLALVALACALKVDRGWGPVQLALAAVAAVVILLWMLEGLLWHARRAQRLREQAAAAARAEELQREAQEAARRAAQQVNAQRRTSHGGMTITVHRAASRSAASTDSSQER